MKQIVLTLVIMSMFLGYAILEQGVNLLDFPHMLVGAAFMAASGFVVYRMVRDA